MCIFFSSGNGSRHVAAQGTTERSNMVNRLPSSISNTSSELYRTTSAARGHEVIRYNDDGEYRHQNRYPPNSIFALLFERPVRRRYYRQLNRSATNLVRRLSQSRLFLNSSRSQNAQYRNSYVGNNRHNNDRAEVIEVDNSNLIDAITAHQENLINDRNNIDIVDNSTATLTRSASMPSINVENETDLNLIPNASDEYLEMAYSSEPELEPNERTEVETPPPAYVDIVKNVEIM